MNLYIINESDRATAFGIGTYIRELSNAINHSNIKVYLIYLRSDSTRVLKDKTDDGINRWYFPSPISEQRTIKRNKQSILYYTNVVYLFQLHILERKNLTFHLNVTQSSKLAEELKKKFDCRVLLSVHYLNWCFKLSGNLTRFRQLLDAQKTGKYLQDKETIKESIQKEKDTFEVIDHILCLSENTRQILQSYYGINPEKLSVIYNGVTDIVQASDKQFLRQKYRIPDAPIFLFAGRLDETKGLKYLIRAFKIVLCKYPNCQLVIAGDGFFEKYLEECEDVWMNVTWTGLVGKGKLYDLYSITDIGVMPSFHEQCSFVAIEMMMHGLPVIGSTTTGLKEMIIDGETGLHIPVMEQNDSVEIDTDLLAEKMLYLLQNPSERERMGANARQRYETVYSAEIFRKNMTAFYQSLFL